MTTKQYMFLGKQLGVKCQIIQTKKVREKKLVIILLLSNYERLTINLKAIDSDQAVI